MQFRAIFFFVFSLPLVSLEVNAANQLSAGQVALEVGGAILGLPGQMRDVYGKFKGAYQIAHCTKEELHEKMRVALFRQDSYEALYLLSIPEFDGTCFSSEAKVQILLFMLLMGKVEILEAFGRKKIDLFEALSDFPQFPNPLLMLTLYSNLKLSVLDSKLASQLGKDTVYVTFNPEKFKRMLYMLTDLGFDINQQFSEWRLTPAMLAAQPLYYMKGIGALEYLEFDLSYQSLLDNQTKLEIIMGHPNFNPELTDKHGRTAMDLFNSQAPLYQMGARVERFSEQFCL